MGNVFSTESAGEAFLVDPPGGASGPGVLVLHSWWGLTDDVRDYCRAIAAEGYTVLAPISSTAPRLRATSRPPPSWPSRRPTPWPGL